MSDLALDLQEGKRLKEEGQAKRETSADQLWLDQARDVARAIATASGQVTSDDVLTRFPRPDWVHPNTVGCIFRKGFVRTGFVATTRPKGHARMIAVWRLR